MSATVRLILAGAVVALGLAAAGWWPAREGDSPRHASLTNAAPSSADQAASDQARLASHNNTAPPSIPVAGPDGAPSSLIPHDPAASAGGYVGGPSVFSTTGRPPSSATPFDMPRTGGLPAADGLTALPRSRGAAATSASLTGEYTPDSSEDPDAQPGDELVAAQATGPRIHEIRDGDTLVDLAERYLGDGRRYIDIYEENRHLLPSPDVLPIGVRIVVPAGDRPRSEAPDPPMGFLTPLQRRPKSGS